MNRPKMFPSKSRLQVAISLEKLAKASLTLNNLCLAEYGRDHLREAFFLADLSDLCSTRLLTLLKPCLYEQKASYYHSLNDRDTRAVQGALLKIRGWRKRYPLLLDQRKDG